MEEGSKELSDARRKAASESMRKRYDEAARMTGMTAGERYMAYVMNRDRLTIQGIRTFGSIAAYKRWMSTPNPLFDGETPQDSIANMLDNELVYDEMSRIQHGDLS